MNRCDKKEKVIILKPGPIGPTGPTGTAYVAPVPRSLKVQLIDGTPTPILIAGFEWENDVPEPNGWPLAGTFTFFKATVVDLGAFEYTEMLNVNGSITHNDAGIQHQAAVAHYRGDTILDIHWASAQLLGTEDSLIAQTLHNVALGDCLYFAISPDVSSLTNFNYNLGSLGSKTTYKLPEDLPLSNIAGPPSSLPIGQPFNIYVTADTQVTFTKFVSGGGGGGAGEASTNDGVNTKIGTGGGGGGGGFIAELPSMALSTGDVLEILLGDGGDGGTESNPDGKNGGLSYIKLNGTLLTPGLTGSGVTGGTGGKGGVNGGDAGNGLIGNGGGGGAALVNSIPGIPGQAGTYPASILQGEDGGTDPRNGGAAQNNLSGGLTKGGIGGSSTSKMGSGGGAGGGGSGGAGGNGGTACEPGEPGEDASNISELFDQGGGGGGGSGGLPASGKTTKGGDGGKGFYAIMSLIES